MLFTSFVVEKHWHADGHSYLAPLTPGDKMRHNTSKYIIPILPILAVFAVYLRTDCPTIYLGDSAELSAAAFALGIPHGSGYPLYVLVGKLFCLIPLGDVGFRMNLVSNFFALMTILLVYASILRITRSMLSAFAGACIMAFIPAFWSQTIVAEVYTLHTFFVALLIWMLLWWDEKREPYILVLFALATGASFGNHMQTVMLAPAVFFLVLAFDKKALLAPKAFLILTVFFLLPLLVYLYLPIRTGAGAAIHWGDPDTLNRFLAHVTGKTHRRGYVLNKAPAEYLIRAKETLYFVWLQFGVVLLLALWGWMRLKRRRWQVFFLLVVLFDFAYTIFLNTISLEITVFTLPTCVVLAILIGVGMAEVLEGCRRIPGIGPGMQNAVRAAFCLMPVAFLLFYFQPHDYSRNYTASEHATNIFRTMGPGSTLFVEADNNAFPVAYGRIVEQERPDVKVYDRFNIIFKMPYVGKARKPFVGEWKEYRDFLERHIIEKAGPSGVFYSIFEPASVSLPEGYALVPYGVLYQVMRGDGSSHRFKVKNVFRYYATESYYDTFERDFHSREICSNFFYGYGVFVFMTGNRELGLRYMRRASRIGYDDTAVHSAIGTFLTREGLFEEARLELQKMSMYYDDLSIVHNNWGYFYHKKGEFEKAVQRFRKAVALKPKRFAYYNNLGFSLYEAGKKEEALRVFQKSLEIKKGQQDIQRFIREHLQDRTDE